jgi:hypothetical protein
MEICCVNLLCIVDDDGWIVCWRVAISFLTVISNGMFWAWRDLPIYKTKACQIYAKITTDMPNACHYKYEHNF